MKKISLIIMLAMGINVIAYSQHGNHSHSHTKDNEKMQVKEGTAVQEFQNQLADVYEQNVKLNEALVASDAQKAASSANEVKSALKKVDMALLKGQDHQDWMKYLETMNEKALIISNTSDIDSQRKAFSGFTDALYKSIKQFGIGGTKAYYQYCPMAFNNQGGYWLSDSKDIKNPYFGSKMLKCGVTKEVL